MKGLTELHLELKLLSFELKLFDGSGINRHEKEIYRIIGYSYGIVERRGNEREGSGGEQVIKSQSPLRTKQTDNFDQYDKCAHLQMPRKKSEDVKCSCGDPTCRIWVSIRTRSNHLRKAAEAARADAGGESEEEDDDDDEVMEDRDVGREGQGSDAGGVMDFDFEVQQDDHNEGLFWDDGFEGNERVMNDRRAVIPEFRQVPIRVSTDCHRVDEDLHHLQPRYEYNHDSDREAGSENENENENERAVEREIPEVEDFDVHNYDARLNEDLTDADTDSESNVDSRSPWSSPAGGNDQQLQPQEPDNGPLDPAIEELIAGLDSLYYHSMSDGNLQSAGMEQGSLDEGKYCQPYVKSANPKSNSANQSHRRNN